jgi:hypothetical protein
MNRFENEIKRKLSDFEAEPPKEIWAAIESRLDKKEIAPVFFWKKFAAAAAILIVLASASLLFIVPLFISTQKLADNELPTPTLENSSGIVAPPTDDQKAPEQTAVINLTNNNTPPSTPANKAAQNNQTIASEILVTFPENISDTYALQIPEMLPYPSSSIELSHQSLQSLDINYSDPLAKTPHRLTKFTITQTNNLPNSLASSAFSVSAYFAPQQAYRFQYGPGATGFTESLESEIMSFATGVQVNYKLNKRWEIQSGLGYNIIGQRVNEIASFSHPSMMPLYSTNGDPIRQHPQSMSTSMGGIIFTDQSLYFADVSSTRIITLKGSYDESIVNLLNKNGTGLMQQFQYLELPVSARYQLFERGLAVYAKAGVIANYLLSGNVYLLGNMPSNDPIGHSVGVSNFNIAGMGGLAFTYPLTNRLQLNLEPTATMFLRPMGQVNNLTRETYPYSWSVYMGISYKL